MFPPSRGDFDSGVPAALPPVSSGAVWDTHGVCRLCLSPVSVSQLCQSTVSVSQLTVSVNCVCQSTVPVNCVCQLHLSADPQHPPINTCLVLPMHAWYTPSNYRTHQSQRAVFPRCAVLCASHAVLFADHGLPRQRLVRRAICLRPPLASGTAGIVG